MNRTMVLLAGLLLALCYIGVWYCYTSRQVLTRVNDNSFARNVFLKANKTSTGDGAREPCNAIRGGLHDQPEEKGTDQYEQNKSNSEKSHTVRLMRNSTDINSDSITRKNQLSFTEHTMYNKSEPTKLPTLTHSSVEPTTETIIFTDNGQRSERTVVYQEPVTGEKHIIFLETRCVLNDSISSSQLGLIIDHRGACAVASAANTNPEMTVYLIYTCSVRGGLGGSPEYVKQMLSCPNVRLWKLTVPEYIRGSPLQNWDFMGKVKSSRWPLPHSSDILRYVTLWKYGGTYVDLDFVFRKPLARLGTNYAGAQYDGYIASGALNFDMDTAGRVVAHLCLRDIQRNFKGYSWDQNGPAVITRVLENLCGTKRVSNMTRQECLGFAVLPQQVFYVIPYPAWRLLFSPSQSKETMKKVADSYGVHVWNKMSSQENVTVGSEQPYGLLAATYCPRVYSNCGPIF